MFNALAAENKPNSHVASFHLTFRDVRYGQRLTAGCHQQDLSMFGSCSLRAKRKMHFTLVGGSKTALSHRIEAPFNAVLLLNHATTICIRKRYIPTMLSTLIALPE